MSKHNRKRKYAKQETDVSESEEILPKNRFKTVTDEDRAEDARRSSILFGGAASFLRSLEEAEQESSLSSRNIDSGIGETDSDDSGNKNKSPAWVDEDDDDIDVGIALDSQNRRLPDGGVNSRSNRYKDLLKNKFETIVGKPKWASLDKKDEYDSDSDSEVLRSCGFVSNKRIKSQLPNTSLEYKRVKDLNREMYVEKSIINVVEYHPSASVSLVAGHTGVAALFAVDGKQNDKIHSVAFEKFPIFCAKFINAGNDVVLGSRQNFIYNYDLMSATGTKITLPHDLTQCKYFITSPDKKYLAVTGKFGEIHLLSSSTKERIRILKQDNNATSLAFNPEGNSLYAHSSTGEVTIFDMNTHRVKHKWIDDGCVQGTNIAISNSNQFVATGSGEGVVNIYDFADTLSNKTPKPRKTLFNLTTGISNLMFNQASEILAFTSGDVENSVRLCHLGSLSVFNNFPNFGTKLGHITNINFSPGSGYLSVGNKKSTVALFRLKHYSNY